MHVRKAQPAAPSESARAALCSAACMPHGVPAGMLCMLPSSRRPTLAMILVWLMPRLSSRARAVYRSSTLHIKTARDKS